MDHVTNQKAIEQTVEIVKAFASATTNRSKAIPGDPSETVDFVQAVYDKLAELHSNADQPKLDMDVVIV